MHHEGWGGRDSEWLFCAEDGWYTLPDLVRSGQHDCQIAWDLPPWNKKLVSAAEAIAMVTENMNSVVSGYNKQPQICSPGTLCGTVALGC